MNFHLKRIHKYIQYKFLPKVIFYLPKHLKDQHYMANLKTHETKTKYS